MRISFLLLIASICFCGGISAQNVLDQDDVYLVDSIGSNSICFHKNMSLVMPIYHQKIVENIIQGIEATDRYIDVENVEFRVLVFPERTIPRIGMSGVAPNRHQIYILLDPDHPKLYEAIDTHIYQTIPHEYHHTMRYRTVGYGESLFESLISEGLACHFAMEVCKIEAPQYCVAYNKETIAKWMTVAEKMWFQKEFDYYDWFVGRTKPKNIGYALGYKLVKDYLDLHSGSKSSSLYSMSANQFLPMK